MTHEHILADRLTLLPGYTTAGIGYSAPSKQVYIAVNFQPTEGQSSSIMPFLVRRMPNDHTIVLRPERPVRNVNPDTAFWSLVCSPTEKKAYAAVQDGSRLFIDTNTNSAYPSRVPTFPRLVPCNMAFSPDGKMSYFPGQNVLYALDEESDAAPVPIPLSVSPNWVVVTNDGAYAYAGESNGNTLSRVDLRTMQEKDTLPLPEALNTFDICNDGSKLYAALQTQVAIIDVAQNSITGSIPYPEYSSSMFVLSCSKTTPRACVTVAGNGNQLAAVIDTASGSKLGTIPVEGVSPSFCTFDEYGDAYIATLGGGALVVHYSVLEAMGPA
jgi:DNA-binding beta-propeller fold protein YncE